MIDSATALELTCRMLGIWGIITALQWWASRADWEPGRPLGWDLLGLKRFRLPAAAALANAAFARPALCLAIALQVLASLALAVLPTSAATPVFLVLLLCATWLLCLRSVTDGADKMALVVILGALLQCLPDQRIVLAGQAWIAGQLTLSYCTSGAAKLRLADWRKGTAPAQAMASLAWGHRRAAKVLSHRGLALGFAWLLMLVETAFILALLAPAWLLLAVLAMFLAFHFATAVFMGLNTYPWAFLASYPSVLVFSTTMRDWLPG